MLVSLRSMPLAAATLATVAGTLCGTAQAAVLALSTAGDDTFVCRAIVSRNDGFLATAAPLKQRIAGKERKYFELGPLEVGDDDVSPNFRRLTLQCWMHDPLDFSTDVPNGARSYSIALNRDDAIEPSWKLRYYVPASAYRLAVDETDDSDLQQAASNVH